MKHTVLATISLIIFCAVFIGVLDLARMHEIMRPADFPINRALLYNDNGTKVPVDNYDDDAIDNNATRSPPPAPFSVVPSRVRCVESVPSYYDAERTAFNVHDEMRNTCIFEDLYVDESGTFFFLEDPATPHSALVLPQLSVMGFPNTHSAPTPFPAAMLHAVSSAFFSNDSFVSFAPILNMVSRTYQTHHGHTLFDGVLSCFFAMRRANLSAVEIARRDTLFQFYDAKGAVPMDDRFALLSSLPPLYGTHATFTDLPRLSSALFSPLVNGSSGRRFIRVERMVIGLAGFGWASAPQTMEWRGQLLREFRTLAFARFGVPLSAQPVSHDINVLLIDRIPSTKMADGKFVNYFSRWIFDEERDIARLVADLAPHNVTLTRVTFEDTPLAYQMSLLQNCSIVITLEGCAMENAPFFRDHTSLIGIQYNRRWEHWYYLSARHFVEYAQYIHVAMVPTRIDDSVIPIQNTGGNFGVHLHYESLLNAVLDAVALQRAPLNNCNGARCGSLIEYTPQNTIIEHLPLL